MEIDDLSVSRNIDDDVIAGMESTPLSISRMEAISRAANNPTKTAIESERVKTGVSDAVKKLDQENNEMFPDKEGNAEATVSNKTQKDEVVSTSKEPKRVLGMNPLALGVVVIGLAVGGYFLYKKMKK